MEAEAKPGVQREDNGRKEQQSSCRQVRLFNHTKAKAAPFIRWQVLLRSSEDLWINSWPLHHYSMNVCEWVNNDM